MSRPFPDDMGPLDFLGPDYPTLTDGGLPAQSERDAATVRRWREERDARETERRRAERARTEAMIAPFIAEIERRYGVRQ